MGSGFFAGRFIAACMDAGTSSFADLVAECAPELLPGAGAAAAARLGGAAGAYVRRWAARGPALPLPHGTTIVAARFADGVVMAGDRRSTAGNMIAQRDIEKVFRSDDFSAVGIAGVAGIGLELVRLFQLELEHYEKLEGRTLSLEGKANRLAAFVRGNMGAAMQGLVVVPLFAGWDEDAGRGRIFSYDVAGGRYEERPYSRHRVGVDLRQGIAEEALHRGPVRPGRGPGPACRRCTTRLTTTRRPADRTWPGRSTRWWR